MALAGRMPRRRRLRFVASPSRRPTGSQIRGAPGPIWWRFASLRPMTEADAEKREKAEIGGDAAVRPSISSCPAFVRVHLLPTFLVSSDAETMHPQSSRPSQRDNARDGHTKKPGKPGIM